MLKYKLRTPLYKYFSVKTMQYVCDILCHNLLYFSNPLSFNDPFDCRICCFTEYSEEEIVKQYIKETYVCYPGYSEEKRKRMIDGFKVIKDKSNLFTKRYSEYRDEQITNYGIQCFSEDFTNLLMWSHYADSHKGICIEFDMEILYELLKNHAWIYNVKYRKLYPKMHLINQKNGNTIDLFARDILLVKSIMWKYEKEWRLIIPAISVAFQNRLVPFPAEAIRKIYLGCQMDSNVKMQIVKLFEEKYKREQIFEMEISNKSFELLFKKFETKWY